MTSTLTVVTPSPAEVENYTRILQTIADEVSPATQKAYAQELRSMKRFYDERQWELFPIHALGDFDDKLYTQQVLSYLQHIVDEGKTYSTIVKTLSAIKHFASYENQRAYSALFTRPVKAFMSGVARQTKAHTPRKAQAFTVEQLEVLYKSMDSRTPRDIRDRAIISFGIATALRSQSLADLRLKDVTPSYSIDGFNVFLPFSKTDQTGNGATIPVAKFSKKRLDPVTMLKEWLTVLKAYGYDRTTTPDFPLFPTVRGQRGVQNGKMAHSSIAITEMLRSRLVASGLCSPEQAEAYSSHSLRSTFITLSSAAGVSEKDIAAISQHHDMNTLRSYDRTSVEKSAQTDYLRKQK